MSVSSLAVDPITAPPEVPIGDVAELMSTEEVGDVVIVKDDRPVGIVTDRDIALAVAEHGDITELAAADVMSEDPATVSADADPLALPEEMAEERVRRIPVVDDGELVGIATLDDLVATVGEELEDVATVIEAQSPGYSPS
ncbi:CBS domain-containing protein [Haloplanus sp. GCM10025708]|uniref:CBS domain-containing protein n=1 Tax=Haloferacaceae TaxID=1644056 RepID=UPI0036074425